MDTRGRHVLAELEGCAPEVLREADRVCALMREAAQAAGATALADATRTFPTGGVSGFVLLAESHISIHTWPEHGYAAVDVYTCGDQTVPEAACRHLAERLGCRHLTMTVIERGETHARGRLNLQT